MRSATSTADHVVACLRNGNVAVRSALKSICNSSNLAVGWTVEAGALEQIDDLRFLLDQIEGKLREVQSQQEAQEPS